MSQRFFYGVSVTKTTNQHNTKGENKVNTITKGNLQAVVDRINRMTGSPMEPYTKTGEVPNQKYSANIGNYHLSGAYGGYALHRMDTDGGGVRDVLGVGHISKRALYDAMFAFIKGMDAVTEKENA